MRIRLRINQSAAMASVAVCIFASACGSPAATPTIDPTAHQQSLEAALSATAEALRPSKTSTPTRKVGSTPTRTPSSIKSPEESPTATDEESPLILPEWVPEGARTRLGRGKINQIAVSQDGQKIAVAGSLGLFLFDAASFSGIWSIPTGQGLLALQFTSDGKEIVALTDCGGFWIYSGTRPGSWWQCHGTREMLFWNADDGTLLRTVRLDDLFDHLILSTDGNNVLLWYTNYPDQGGMELMDASSGEVQFSLEVEADSMDYAVLQDAALSPDGSLIAGSFSDGTIRLWNKANGEKIRTLTDPNGGTPDRIAFLPGGDKLVSLSDGSIDIWNVSGGPARKVFTPPSLFIRGFAVSPDGSLLVTVGYNYAEKVTQWNHWDLDSSRLLLTYTEPSDAVNQVIFDPDGKNLIVAGDYSIRTRDFGSGRILQTMEDPFMEWLGARFLSDADEVAIRSKDEVIFYDPINISMSDSSDIPDGAVFSPDYGWYAFPTASNEINVVNTRTGTLLHSMHSPAYYDANSSLFLSMDGNKMAIAYYPEESSSDWDAMEYRVDIWNPGSGTLSHSLSFQTIKALEWGVEISPDFQRIANIMDYDSEHGIKAVDIYDVASGRLWTEFLSYYDDNDFTFSLSAKEFSGRCFDDSLLCIYQVEDGAVLMELSPFSQGNGIAAVAFSPDGKWVSAGSRDGFITLWDAATGNRIHTYKSDNGAIVGLSFSTDGNRLVSTGDGSVVIWDLGS